MGRKLLITNLSDRTVTIRRRDDGSQERVNIADLMDYMDSRLRRRPIGVVFMILRLYVVSWTASGIGASANVRSPQMH